MEKHEKALEDAKARLVEAQKGFLIEFGWSPRDSDSDTWQDPRVYGQVFTTAEAVHFAKNRVSR